MLKKTSARSNTPHPNITTLLLFLCGVLFWFSAFSGMALANGVGPSSGRMPDNTPEHMPSYTPDQTPGQAAISSSGPAKLNNGKLLAQTAQPKNKRQAVRKPTPRQQAKPDSAPLTVATRSLIHKDASCSVMVNYPQVGNEKIDAELDFWANKTVRTFVSGIESFVSGEANRYSMLVDYELTETSSRFISIVFRISTETGGAHPDSGMVTFTYDLSDGRKLEMHDIFGDAPGLLQFLSLYSYENLLSELGQEFENSIKHGTSPNILNFSLFSLRPDGLVLYFPPYQVADYARGERQVRISYSKLKAYKPRADLWRTGSEYGSISGNTRLLPESSGGAIPEERSY